jgi:HEPN domain-containing protein
MSDLALARLGVKADDVLPEQVCFHAQQAVEKAVKSVLLYHHVRFPLIHDLETLIDIAGHERIALPAWADDVAMLTPYAVETRYPGHWEDFRETEVSSALKMAQQAVEWARAILVAKG